MDAGLGRIEQLYSLVKHAPPCNVDYAGYLPQEWLCECRTCVLGYVVDPTCSQLKFKRIRSISKPPLSLFRSAVSLSPCSHLLISPCRLSLDNLLPHLSNVNSLLSPVSLLHSRLSVLFACSSNQHLLVSATIAKKERSSNYFCFLFSLDHIVMW